MSNLKEPKTLTHEKMYALTTQIAILLVKTVNIWMKFIRNYLKMIKMNMPLTVIYFQLIITLKWSLMINNCEISMPKIFEDETKFSEPISENMAKFIKMGCTQKADISKFLEDGNIPENCKNWVPPLINSEIWNNLYPNVQHRDGTMQDAQKFLGLSIVPMINLAEMFKINKLELKKSFKNVCLIL